MLGMCQLNMHTTTCCSAATCGGPVALACMSAGEPVLRWSNHSLDPAALPGECGSRADHLIQLSLNLHGRPGNNRTHALGLALRGLQTLERLPLEGFYMCRCFCCHPLLVPYW